MRFPGLTCDIEHLSWGSDWGCDFVSQIGQQLSQKGGDKFSLGHASAGAANDLGHQKHTMTGPHVDDDLHLEEPLGN